MTKYYYLFRSNTTLLQRLYYKVNVYNRIYRIVARTYMNDRIWFINALISDIQFDAKCNTF